MTDALLMLGLIEPTGFADGSVALDVNAPERVCVELAERFQLDPIGLARSVHGIAIANVAQALRLSTTQRGRDPRDYALCPYGGAGPLLGAHVAAELGITHIVVPPAPGVFSAFGLCVADMRMDFVRALPGLRVSDDTVHTVQALFVELCEEAELAFTDIGNPADGLRFSRLADARYVGQGYELRISVEVDTLSQHGSAHIANTFHNGHKQQYGHDFPERSVELVNLRVVAERGRASEITGSTETRPASQAKSRRVLLKFGGNEWPVFDRLVLTPEWQHAGPVLIVEETTSTVVPEGWTVAVGSYGVLDITR